LPLLLCLASAYTQTVISGKVTSTKKEPVAGASVTLKDTAIGVTTDSAGNFSLNLQKGKHSITVSSIGYVTRDIDVTVKDAVLSIDIILKEEGKMLGEVVVSAGSFEATDKAKGASLTPMDAVTVAGSNADLAMALRALPGAQQVGDREGLFVRGGTGEETKQFIDGALMPSPNYSSVPGIPQPARINPFLFKGILFSTGGYSALFGDALSSALILESVDLPGESSASLHIFPQDVGVGLQELDKHKKYSYGIEAHYGNLQPYNNIIKQKPDFFHGPEYLEGSANFRIKTGKTGMLKFYTAYGYNNVGMRNNDADSASLLSSFQTKGQNVYSNISYRDMMGKHWKLDAVVAYNYNHNSITNKLEDGRHRQLFIPAPAYTLKNGNYISTINFAQARAVLTRTFSRSQAIRLGAEHFYTGSNYLNNDTLNKLTNNLTAVFAEGDVYIARNIAAKIGARLEHSFLFNKTAVAPRMGLAYRFANGGQLNAAYGIFYQQPETVYLTQAPAPTFTQATHYILNYQKKANNRLLRIEAYYKLYKNLITTIPSVANSGKGYARGIELFFRDKRTFKGFDYWITYTYLDTKRKFLDYPAEIRPSFSTPHTASVAIKRYFSEINFDANLSWSFATGRPYYNIQTDASGKSFINDEGTAKTYNNLNLSFAYLFSMFKKWKQKDISGIGFGINNVFGAKQVFGYNYSYNGLQKTAIEPPAVRSYYIGLFMSFGIDRTDDFINSNL